MASSLALKKLLASNLLTKVAGPVRFRPVAATVESASRLFNTEAIRVEDDDDESPEVNRRPYVDFSGHRGYPPKPFSVLFEPSTFSARPLSQILNLMDRQTNSPLPSASQGIRYQGWDAKETDDGLILRMDMPGIGKEDVKVSIEQNTLVIKAEANKDSEDSERRYTSRLELPENAFKTEEIKAEMKNGVLKVMLPRVKEEERTDVFHVKVD